MVLIQGDFTDQPEHLPELVKRFEGVADIVVVEQNDVASTPVAVKRLRRIAQWVLKPFVSVPGIRDPFSGYRLYRISVLRDLLKETGESPIVRGDGWAANVDLLRRASTHARRVETLSLEPRYDVRARASRVRPLAHAMQLFRYARATRTQPSTGARS